MNGTNAQVVHTWTSFPTRPVSLLILLAITVIGVIVRLDGLEQRSLWFDEAFSWKLSQFPWPEMFQRAMRDNNPPLYYVVLKLWEALWGDSALALRSLSIVFAALTIVGVYFFVAEAFTFNNDSTRPHGSQESRIRELGLLAAALVALSVFQVRWASEARMYSLGAALAISSSWALFRAMRRATYSSWILYASLATAFLYTHTYAVFTVAAQTFFLVDYFIVRFGVEPKAMLRGKLLRGAFLAELCIAVGYSFWVPTLLRQGTQVQAGFWSFPLEASYITGVFHQMFLAPETFSPASVTAILVTIICSGIWLALLWKPKFGEWYVFLATGVPVLLAIGVSLIGRNIFDARYLLFTQVFFWIACARFICRIGHSGQRRSLALIVLLASLGNCHKFSERLAIDENPGARGAASFIDHHRRKDDFVIVSSPIIYYPLIFHSGHQDRWLLYDDGQHPHLHYLGTAVLEPEILIDSQTVHAIKGGNVWIVDMADKGDTARKRYEVAVPQSWKRLESSRFPDIYDMQGTIEVAKYAVEPAL